MNAINYSLLLMAGFYFYAGYSHFKKPKFFYRITPPLLKQWEKEINIIVGVAEIVGAIGLLIPSLQTWAAWGIILLLLAVFPANIYHLMSKGAGMKIPLWFLWLRIPLQGVLIWWAYSFT
ncbi:MAG: DoxX family protein [Bacteroidetes bacterium]|jgi:uncharacterized membrane protein|nr:DoxX family protein [Bacteroidota bacterium]MDF1863836.1 DoxX family protein [Saprospiraceae bacterium]